MGNARPIVFLITVWQCLAPALADTLGIDQRNDDFTPSLYQGLQSFAPMGQEFTPTVSNLSFVDLYTEGFLPTTAGLFVNIRTGTILGSILGTSDIVSTGSLFGETEFLFAAAVPLTPGDVYVIDVEAVDGRNWGIGSEGFPTYSGGNEILDGQPDARNDLWFREGYIPEPSGFSLLLTVCGVLALNRYAPQLRIPWRNS